MDGISEYNDEEKISNLNITIDSDDFNYIDFSAQNDEGNFECELNAKRNVCEKSVDDFAVNKSNEFPDSLLQK